MIYIVCRESQDIRYPNDDSTVPGGIWALDNGTVYVADVGNHRVPGMNHVTS